MPLNANEEGLPKLSSLGTPSGVDKGPSRGNEDLQGILQMEELNQQMEQAKQIARTTAPGMAHPYLNAILGIAAQALDPEVAGPAFKAGTNARMAPALQQYKTALENAQDIIDEGERRQKAFQNILASNPDALIPMVREGNRDDMVQLGLAAFGIPVAIDPRAKSDMKLNDLYRKNRIAYHQRQFQAAIQIGNNELAAAESQALKDIMDPDGESSIDPEDFVNRNKAMTMDPAKVAANYEEADEALKATAKFQLDGDHTAYITTLGGLHARKKSDRAQTRLEKIGQLAIALGNHMRETGETDPAKALKGMDETFQLEWNAIMTSPASRPDVLTRDDYLREERGAHDDALNYYRMLGYEPDESEVRALAAQYLRERLQRAERLAARAARSQRKIVDEAQKAPENQPKLKPMSLKDWEAKVIERAAKSGRSYPEESRKYASELSDAKQGDLIPPSVRRKERM